MNFEQVLDQAIDMLYRRGRLTYRMLKRQFDLADEAFDDLKEELIYGQRVAIDEDERVLVWNDEAPAPTPNAKPETDFATETHETSSTQIEPLPQDHQAPEAERRQLTVMFCDLVDSTSLSGELDPEDLREVVQAYQSAATEVIQHFQGYVAQHLGDGILCYFGYPIAHEDDAQRAVRSGLGIIDAIKTLNQNLEQNHGIQLAVRISVHTGAVVVGNIGAGDRQEQLALGETPNVAARIQGLAEPDTVVISDATYRLIQGYFDCNGLGEQTLRGVAEPIPVYQVLSESGAQSRLEVAVARGLTPLVGREQEIGLLINRWEQAKDGQGQIVLLSGEAGIGKSRLVQVLKEHVATLSHIQLECRSSPYYQNTVLYPITDLFQRTLQWEPEDNAEEKLRKLEVVLGRYQPALEESVPLLSTLLSLPVPEDRYPPLNLTPQRQRQKVLETFVALFVEESEYQPVLFIVEDLHWIDPTTLELLELLIDQSPTASILTLLTCRPEYQPSWSHRSYLTEITVNRLSLHQTEQMSTEVASGKRLPPEVLGQLVAQTDGVPLYVEEMTKAVLESGALKETNGHYELVGPLTSLTIPSTLQDSLMSRLDRLKTAKVIAQLGATIGRQFPYVLLQAVSQVDEGTLHKELSRLVDAELLYQRGLPPQSTYTFKHALIQDTAYESLLRRTRQKHHRDIAEVLEERFPDTQPEQIAHHYMEAGLNEQAVGYWQQAGERAVRQSAYAEGIAHLTKGLALLETFPKTASHRDTELDILLVLAHAFHVTKGFQSPEVEQTCIRARELCDRIGETPRRIEVLYQLRVFYTSSGELRTALEFAEELFRLAQQTQDSFVQLRSFYDLGLSLAYMGVLSEGHTHLAEGAALGDRLRSHSLDVVGKRGVLDVGLICHREAIWVLWLLGYVDQAREQAQKTLFLSQQQNHPYTLAGALLKVAWVHLLCREASVVQEQIARHIALCREHEFTGVQSGMTINGWALVHQGQQECGMIEIRRGIKTIMNVQNQPWYLSLFAEVCGITGHVEEGIRTLARAREVIEQSEARWWEAEIYRLEGELLLQQITPDALNAESCFHHALDIAHDQRAKSLELRAATSLARLWQSQNKRWDAYKLLSPVYEWFTEGFDTADLQDAQALLKEPKR